MYQSIVSFTLKIENFIRTADTYCDLLPVNSAI